METSEYKTTLQTLLGEVTAELETIGKRVGDGDDWEATPEPIETLADQNEAADNVEDWNERRSTLAQLETRYRNIKRALEKIDAGTFGQCEVCEQPISDERLAIQPAARTCTEHLNEEDSLPL